jgi:hypothetical protein
LLLFLISDFTTFAPTLKLAKHISHKSLQTVFGILLGLLVLTQSAIVPEQIEDKQEQSDSQDNEKQQLSKAEAVPSTSLQINLDYQSYLLNEVFHQDLEDQSAPIVKLTLPSAQKALKILFRRIISPNAP